MKRLSSMSLALATLGLATVGATNEAQAQDGFEATAFRPAVTDSDLRDHVLMYRSEHQVPGAVGLNATTEYVNDSLDYASDGFSQCTENLWGTQWGFFVGLAKPLGLGVAIPTYWGQEGTDGTQQGSGIGDMQIVLPITLFKTRDDVDSGKARVGVSLIPYTQAPTGTKNADRFLSDDAWSGGGMTQVSVDAGPVTVSGGFTAGYRGARDDVDFEGGAEIGGDLGLIVKAGDHHAIGAEGRLISNINADPADDASRIPAEFLGTFRGHYNAGFNWLVGAGAGLSNAAGVPDYRVMANLGWTIGKNRRGDLDVVVVDQNGNPIYGATVDDQMVARSTNAEGMAELGEVKGGETVNITVTHPSGRYTSAQTSAEVPRRGHKTKTVQLDWKPADLTVITEGPGGRSLQGASVEAASEDELYSGLTDAQGMWRTELSPGSWAVKADLLGFESALETIELAPAESRVITLRLGGDMPDSIDGRQYFDFDKSFIRENEKDELDMIIGYLNDHPEIERVEVQGHTDIIGSHEYNNGLSIRRAKAVVQYMTDAGISSDRLVIRGLSYDCPADTNETDAGRQNNRRVQYHMLKPHVAEDFCKGKGGINADGSPYMEQAPLTEGDGMGPAMAPGVEVEQSSSQPEWDGMPEYPVDEMDEDKTKREERRDEREENREERREDY